MTLSRFRVSERQSLHFIMVACVIGLASTFLIVFLRRQTARTEPAKQPLIRWMSPRTSAAGKEIRSLIAELDDPSLMSLPDSHAFSRRLWQRQLEATASPIQPPDAPACLDTEPPRELATLLPPAPLAETVRAAANKPVAAVAEPRPAMETPRNHSAIQFDGALASLTLTRAPLLPAVASEAPLRNTRLRLAIAADGTVQLALIERSCGDDNADTLALGAARQLRFALPVETDRHSLLWGAARVLWATKMP
jgi:hypothetical protein